MKNKFNLKAIQMPYKKLEKSGFDFKAFEHKANLIITGTSGKSIFFNALILGDMAVLINDKKTEVCIIKLSENPHVEVQKIDQTKIN